MNVVLIRPPIVVPKSNVVVQYTPPIGLASIAGSVRAAGYKVQLIDGLGEALDARHSVEGDCFLYGLTLDQVVNRINENPDIIGISAAFSFEWPTCQALIQKIRLRFPHTLLVGGGEHMTALPQESLQASQLDMAVLGEGEEVMVRIVETASNKEDVSHIPGTAFKNREGFVHLNERHNRIRAIDDIARPAWDLTPIQHYLDRQMGFGVNRGRSMPILASRGCPYRCTFCSSPNMWTTRWIARDPELLLDEIAFYQKAYQITNFDFYDLTAIVRKSWIKNFCQKILERGMIFTWQLPSGSRSEAIDRDVAQLLYRSGCRNLSFSPESGSPTVLTRIQKNIEPTQMLAAMKCSVQAGMNVKVNLMFGFPGETIREILESFRYIAAVAWIGAHDLSIWAFSPYPGSLLFDQLRKDGQVVLDAHYYDKLRSYADNSDPLSYSEQLDNHRLKQLRTWGTLLFYFLAWSIRPWRPFIIIRNVLRGKHESRGELVLSRRLLGTRIGRWLLPKHWKP